MTSRRISVPATPEIVVVGAGIVGASAAYHLTRRGAAVTIVESDHPAGGVTGKAFGWINVAQVAFGARSPLRQLAGEDWRRVARDLGGALDVNWCGALSWHANTADTEQFASNRVAEGYEIRLVGRAEIAGLEPGLIDPPACAAYAEGDGMTDPSAATKAMVQAACRAGARLCAGARAVEPVARGGRVVGVRTSGGTVAADVVVAAAGVGTASLCRPLGVDVPIGASPALLLRFSTRRPLVRGIVSAPDLEVRQACGTVLLAAELHADDGSESEALRVAERTLATVGRRLRGGGGATLAGATIGVRPMPADSLPIVGFTREVDGLYLVAMHSGVTMAPTIGRLAAAEILEGSRSPLLGPCRPERFDPPGRPLKPASAIR